MNICALKRKTPLRRTALPQRRRNKYNAQRVSAEENAVARTMPELAGRSFASGLELRRGIWLVCEQRAGRISELVFQPQVHMTRARVGYKPDFRYEEAGRTIYEEVKGRETYPWITNRRLWRVYGPGVLRVVKAGRMGGCVVTETIVPHPTLAGGGGDDGGLEA